MHPPSPIIEFDNVSKSFGAKTALANLTLSIEPQQFVVLLGSNGAGKTTLLRLIATLARPTRGSIQVAGLDTVQHGEQVRQQIGFASHETLLYEDMSVEKNLQFHARMHGLDDPADRIEHLLDIMDLTTQRLTPTRTLSRGMQQRLSIARAMLHNPQVLLLDEPLATLDTPTIETLSTLLHTLNDQGHTILLTTNNSEHILLMGTRAIALSKGRITHDELRDPNLTMNEGVYEIYAAFSGTF